MKKTFITIIFILASKFLLAQTYPVVWQELFRIAVNADNSLTKTLVSQGYNAGAASQNMLLAGQNGYLEFTFATGSTYAVGLSRLNNSPNDASMDCTMALLSSGSVSIRQSGVQVANSTATAGNVMKISREGGDIKFYRNGTVLHTLSLSSTYNLRVDVSIYSGSVPVIITSFRPALVVKPVFQFPDYTNTNGSISLDLEGSYAPVTYSWSSGETTSSITNKPRGEYTVTVTDAQGRTVTKTFHLGYPVAWTNIVGATLNPDNSLRKSTASAWDNSASSLNVLPPNTDGWIEFVIKEPPLTFSIGLIRIDRVDPAYAPEAQYIWRFSAAGGSASIWENDVAIGTFIGSNMKGDVIRIARVGSNIKYYVNGTEVRSVATTASIPYVVMLGLFDNTGDTPIVTSSFDKAIRVTANPTFPGAATNQGGGFAPVIQGAYEPYTVQWSSGEQTTNISNKPRGTYTLTITDAASRVFTRSYYLGYPAKWTDLQNTTLHPDNTMTSSGGGSWAGSAITANILLPNTDGWVEYEYDRLPGNIMIGLAVPNAVANYPSINFCFYITSSKNTPGGLAIVEAGSTKTTLGVMGEGDVFRIGREGSNIKYYWNGTEVRSTATNAALSLIVDMASSSGETPKVSTSFTNPARTFYAIKTSNWTDLTAWSFTEGGAAAQVYPGRGDVAYVKGYTMSVLTGIYCSDIHVAATNPSTVLKVDGTAASLNVSGKVYVKGDGTTTPVKSLVVQNSAKLNVVNGE